MSTTKRLKHFIRHTEEIELGCFEVSTLTEDGHRLSGFGATIKQAIQDAHEKASSYGDYDFPTYGKPQGGVALCAPRLFLPTRPASPSFAASLTALR